MNSSFRDRERHVLHVSVNAADGRIGNLRRGTGIRQTFPAMKPRTTRGCGWMDIVESILRAATSDESAPTMTAWRFQGCGACLIEKWEMPRWKSALARITLSASFPSSPIPTQARCHTMKRSWRNILLVALLATTSGCATFWHDLKPHRMRRFNRVSAPSLNPEFTRLDLRPRVIDESPRPATLTANSADVILARGKSGGASIVTP